MESVLSLQGVSKSFGDVEALHTIDLTVAKGEFLTLLGPSGCGKTTTLRIIAGLERPDTGKVLLSGQDVTDLPPNKRDVNTVFQSYALFPHMNVATNIGYGLRVAGVSKDQIRKRVGDMLDLIQLPGYEKRMPSQLSGGQRQRVAIARAMIANPKILLLDEPLGALDLQLRRQMQVELKRLQSDSAITFIYITHDQEEALNMSDRIGVMHEGKIQQIGTPDEIYDHPKTRFTAQFIGQANLIDATVTALIPGGEAQLAYSDGTICILDRGYAVGQELTLCIRAERLDYNTQENRTGFSLRGQILETLYAGGTVNTTIRLANGKDLRVSGLLKEDRLPNGTQVNIFWDPHHVAIVGEGGTPI